MATHLDLEEQEQLDELKAFWKKYGTPIIWAVIVVLAIFAGRSAWTYWQRDQASKAGAIFDQLDKAVQANDVDQAASIFSDLTDRYPSTVYTAQAGLLTAKLQFDKNQPDAALSSLSWVEEHADDNAYRTIARLRSAGVLMDQKKYDNAFKQLDGVTLKDGEDQFAPLVDDRRGDVLMMQGKAEEAKAAYSKAWHAMSDKVDYRRLIEAKLGALGAAPIAASPAVTAAAEVAASAASAATVKTTKTVSEAPAASTAPRTSARATTP